MREVFYHSKEEREKLLKEAKRLGEHQIHDDFLDEDGNTTDNNSGRLTLVKESEPHPVDEGALFTKLDLNFHMQCEAIQIITSIFSEMYESYDEKKLKEFSDKAGIDIENPTWDKVISAYEFRKRDRWLELCKEYGTTNFSVRPTEVDSLIMTMGMRKMTLPNNPDFLRDMSLVYLVVIFQQFLKKILKTVYTTEILKGKAVDTEIDNKIEKHVKFDIEKTRTSLMKEYKINIAESYWHEIILNGDMWKRFKEYFYRRNVIVHVDGVADKKYRKLSDTDTYGKLSVTQKYLQEAIKDFKTYAKNTRIAFSDKFVSK